MAVRLDVYVVDLGGNALQRQPKAARDGPTYAAAFEPLVDLAEYAKARCRSSPERPSGNHLQGLLERTRIVSHFVADPVVLGGDHTYVEVVVCDRAKQGVPQTDTGLSEMLE